MQSAAGTLSLQSPHSIDATLSRLQTVIAGRGLTLFAHIDHGEGARLAGLAMQPAHVLVFGNAKAGTPVMNAYPQSALDLPLKVLVWEDADHQVWATFSTPEYFASRYGIEAALMKPLSGVEALVRAALG